MLRADVGYDAANVLTATMILPDGDYTPERRLQAVEDVVTRLRVMPGVTNAAYTTATPFSSVITLSSFTLRKRDGSTETRPERLAAGQRRLLRGSRTACRRRTGIHRS